ncbi:RNA-directed DNA polymerase (reverse transcriptase)-related family protein [Rhynchospora pubera]|uniref:RNA-directed DNA polymerase (Reverse transcriptase)-related family protein n=1 Tax=Rhynchospora pubera TaxID=906938 RepID=A0AAV8BWW1_9POAL|nr:RNA-directed DNA polymerase (reverse transcriptase)-related family protein [Rhynchospora pubera]
MEIEGHNVTDRNNIEQHILEYYRSLLGSEGCKVASFHNNFWEEEWNLDPVASNTLEQPFTLEEVYFVVFDSDPTGTPGPDGISFSFYQTYWDLVKEDILKVVNSFYDGTLQLVKLNKACISLIPKNKNAKLVTQYRPISLVNCSAKILTKMLTNRLELVMDSLIENTQAGFMKGRYILDNAVLAHEIIHDCKTSRQQGVIIKVDFEKAYDRVSWSYMDEVLTLRGFGNRWRGWIQSIFKSSLTCILFNGTPSIYFPCKRGLRQGDPLSPFLFNIAADTLARMFHRGRQAQIIHGLGPSILNNIPITNIHYADDIIFFLQANVYNIEHVKWAMLLFEALTGIKINFSKTELIGINIDESLCHHLAQVFGCKVGSLPLHYLGIPLHYRKLTNSDWSCVVDKVSSKLQQWKGAFLSIGGRLILVNSVLSAVPLYTLSMYKMPENVKKQINIIRRTFLWQGGHSHTKKYALVNWARACLRKEFDGMGILELGQMNISLLLKWWWKLKSPNHQGLWKTMIRTKYENNRTLSKMSPFWKEIQKLNPLGHSSCRYQLGNGRVVSFWNDIWVGDCSLASCFSYLYKICSNRECTVAEVVVTHGRNLLFQRSLTGMLLHDFYELLDVIQNTVISPEEDEPVWRWDSKGCFSTQSCYNFLNFRGIKVKHSNLWWKIKIPYKVQIFMWLLHKNRILTKTNLLKRGWVGSPNCTFCTQDEDSTHLFLSCPYIQHLWFWMGYNQNVFQSWTNLQDVVNFSLCLQNNNKQSFLLVYSAFCWNVVSQIGGARVHWALDTTRLGLHPSPDGPTCRDASRKKCRDGYCSLSECGGGWIELRRWKAAQKKKKNLISKAFAFT